MKKSLPPKEQSLEEVEQIVFICHLWADPSFANAEVIFK